MGLALCQRREANHRIDTQSGQPDYERGQTRDGSGRMGARLLFEVSKSPAGIHRSLVERGELGRDREEFRVSEIGQPQVSTRRSAYLEKTRPAELQMMRATQRAELWRNAMCEVPVRCGTVLRHRCTTARWSSSADTRIPWHP